MSLLRLAALIPSLLLVLVTLRSAVRTFVLPRSARDPITRAVFLLTRKLFDLRLHWAHSYASRDRVMALYAPAAVLGLTACWVVLTILGFAGAYWALGEPLPRALTVSGSTLLTLGFEKPVGWAAITLSFAEGGIGLTLVALLVSYLPAMYTAFARRESAVTMLEIRAGSPPAAVELLVRTHQLGGMEQIDLLWGEWQQWFVELEESHTSLGALSFFRSPQPQRSWVTAAGAVLDAVSLAGAVLRRGPSPSERLTLRAGSFALRRIAEFFGLPSNPHPDPSGPVSVRRHEFDEAYERLVREDVEVCTDPEQAWADFVASRAQYDEVLLALAALTMAPAAPWSSDRATRVRSRPQPDGRRHTDPLSDPERRGVLTTAGDRAHAVPLADPRTPDPIALDGGLEDGSATDATGAGRRHGGAAGPLAGPSRRPGGRGSDVGGVLLFAVRPRRLMPPRPAPRAAAFSAPRGGEHHARPNTRS
jgi:hypothetical protein